jgi:hypothetical protein
VIAAARLLLVVALLIGATAARADSPVGGCTCGAILGQCSASVSASTKPRILSSSAQCSRVKWFAGGEPFDATFENSSFEVAADQLREPVVMISCEICTRANDPTASSGDLGLSEGIGAALENVQLSAHAQRQAVQSDRAALSRVLQAATARYSRSASNGSAALVSFAVNLVGFVHATRNDDVSLSRLAYDMTSANSMNAQAVPAATDGSCDYQYRELDERLPHYQNPEIAQLKQSIVRTDLRGLLEGAKREGLNLSQMLEQNRAQIAEYESQRAAAESCMTNLLAGKPNLQPLRDGMFDSVDAGTMTAPCVREYVGLSLVLEGTRETGKKMACMQQAGEQ